MRVITGLDECLEVVSMLGYVAVLALWSWEQRYLLLKGLWNGEEGCTGSFSHASISAS